MSAAKRRKPGRKRLPVEEHRRRGTFQPVRHAVKRRLDTGFSEKRPSTWFVDWPPYEQRLWQEFLLRYVPGDRLACYHFISWQAACEVAAYWARPGDPRRIGGNGVGAARLADLFKATRWRRR